eukprot:2118216-Prymnesium_polylepis.1
MAMVTIDLCTPPASPDHDAMIDLCSDDNIAENGGSNSKRPAEAAIVAVKVAKTSAATEAKQVPPPVHQRTCAASSSSDAFEAACDEVLETGAPAPELRDAAMDDADEDDDDVKFVGRTGDLALADFPHARENCAAFKYVQGQEQKCCPNCFCYVCEYAQPHSSP